MNNESINHVLNLFWPTFKDAKNAVRSKMVNFQGLKYYGIYSSLGEEVKTVQSWSCKLSLHFNVKEV